ncbi:2,5-dichloro-2,5-cyclohexadiene-1,4-diol dehydrogenase LinX [Cupriavidus yeoncheonensis]|uniref:2,5-dichloro-2,5-cyclohexadiene-1,4-diol dehydrogenase LinX n=1 Tax=Cupriavidus yeoncheonensis TaxID=1462994 RepID=A0A916J2C5_9BURK|nr:glucose 1-dehydrogenase [Cupriavidus yeoncheonensis]CAG2158361.1 2,5-dichloro-2,5-cyclohexadiene-1,4-diol dehydrogenase LinX [Cupriavidus yeoncheonensis]
MRLQGKAAIITGAAGGIGRATALGFAREGASIVVTDIHRDGAQEVADTINAAGGRAVALAHDVGCETQWTQVVGAAVEAFGTVDVLFNNAGIFLLKPLVETTLDEWNRLMAINVTGVLLGMKHVMPLMARAGKGSVINVSSVAGLVGSPRSAMYSASKGAVRAMTKAAALEFAARGVRVNSIHPGLIDTAMADYASGTAGRSKQDLGQVMSPMGRLGTADEVGGLALFLASDESSYMNGAELVLDGGFTAA